MVLRLMANSAVMANLLLLLICLTGGQVAIALPIDKLYFRQQQEADVRFARNLRYCTALFDKAKYEEDREAVGTAARYYIVNGVLMSIDAQQPGENGASCNRSGVNNRVIGKLYTRIDRASLILPPVELRMLGIPPNKVMGRFQDLLRIEGDEIVEYSKDLDSGKISRSVLAHKRRALIHSAAQDIFPGELRPEPPVMP